MSSWHNVKLDGTVISINKTIIREPIPSGQICFDECGFYFRSIRRLLRQLLLRFVWTSQKQMNIYPEKSRTHLIDVGRFDTYLDKYDLIIHILDLFLSLILSR